MSVLDLRCLACVALLVVVTTGCASKSVDESTETTSSQTATEPAGASNTSEPQTVTAVVESELRARYGEFGGELRYFYATNDLDSDSQPEIIVYVVSPMLCGTGGCNTLVLTPSDTGYSLVAEITVTRPPIQVSPRSTKGWQNLIVHVSGGGILPGYDAELRFDGTRYPGNPTVSPAEPAPDTGGVEVLIPIYESFTDATLVPPE